MVKKMVRMNDECYMMVNVTVRLILLLHWPPLGLTLTLCCPNDRLLYCIDPIPVKVIVVDLLGRPFITKHLTRFIIVLEIPLYVCTRLPFS